MWDLLGTLLDLAGPVGDPVGPVKDPLRQNSAGLGASSSRCVLCGGSMQMQQEKCMACFLEFLA